jgi:hypothetical protein
VRGYSESDWERAMKVQEVILQAMAKRITWWQAAEILGISDRSVRRWRFLSVRSWCSRWAQVCSISGPELFAVAQVLESHDSHELRWWYQETSDAPQVHVC